MPTIIIHRMVPNGTLLIREYINALILNIDKSKLPNEIDLVFSGGAFNGLFGIGILYYIKALEQHKLTTVRRVSGCSIGSLLALWYIMDCDEDPNLWFADISKKCKKTQNLTAYNDKVEKTVYNLFKTDESVATLNGLLFISFYDMKKRRQKVISKYNGRDHLIDCLIRSSYIPKLTDGKMRYKERYIDGITPYIFKDNVRDILVIELMTMAKMMRCFSINKEANAHFRLLTGVADASEFFSRGKSDMCSYYRSWSFINYFSNVSKEFIIVILISLIEIISNASYYIPNPIKETLIWHTLFKVVNGLYDDVLYKVIL